jgi:pimeloyl-ACP methyl ester carboxylesterase
MDKCEWEIEFFLELGYDVWTMDYRGFGNSSGTSSESALIEDAAAVYWQITKQFKVQEESLVVWGRSLGSGVAASVAARNKPRMLVLETPYWSLVDVVRQKHPYIPSILFRYRLPSHEYLESVDCPIHLIHGTQDETIPFNSSERLAMHCEESNRRANGHAIMCGKHNLRTCEEFAEISNKILK